MKQPKNPLVSGITSCSISVAFWIVILLANLLEGDTYIAAYFYILWLVAGIPVSLGFSIRAFYLIHKGAKRGEEADTLFKAKVMSWLSVALLIIPALVMGFLV